MKKLIIFSILFGIILLASGFFIKTYWIPGKYAIRENEFSNYAPYILIQEVHYTGTGWVQTGDENTYFSSSEYKDIDLKNGTILPQMAMYHEEYANTFLCKVEYNGKIWYDAFEEEIDSYTIIEWYPVYPILRETILPDWIFPKSFMTTQEVKSLTIPKP